MALELAKTKRILEMLVDKGALAPDKHQGIVELIDKGLLKEQYSGEFAVKNEHTTQAALDEALKEQAEQKALAAVKDIQTIAEKGAQPAADWLKVNIGHGGVATPAAEKATPIEGAAAAANIAQNIVLMANKAPTMAKDLVKSVEAASALAIYLTSDPKQQLEVPVETLKQWQTDANFGLSSVAFHLANGTPTPEQVGNYLTERQKEISSALGMNQWQDRVKNPTQQGSNLPPL